MPMVTGNLTHPQQVVKHPQMQMEMGNQIPLQTQHPHPHPHPQQGAHHQMQTEMVSPMGQHQHQQGAHQHQQVVVKHPQQHKAVSMVEV